jgi:hypothetical protein
MILISHRGNINGRIKDRENEPSYVEDTIRLGFDVEIDVWFKDGVFYLGHDQPQYEVDYKFLVNENLWCHAKNVDALLEMKKYAIHYFWHEEDTLTLTSKNYIWVYPGKQPIKRSIAVMPELYNDDVSQCIGVCSDYILKYKL